MTHEERVIQPWKHTEASHCEFTIVLYICVYIHLYALGIAFDLLIYIYIHVMLRSGRRFDF